MAIPQILQQLGQQTNPAIGQIKQMMQALRSAQNPQEVLNQLAMNNPQLRQVMDIIQKHGGDPMTAFKATAEEMGVNPDEIINMLK